MTKLFGVSADWLLSDEDDEEKADDIPPPRETTPPPPSPPFPPQETTAPAPNRNASVAGVLLIVFGSGLALAGIVAFLFLKILTGTVLINTNITTHFPLNEIEWEIVDTEPLPDSSATPDFEIPTQEAFS